MGLRASKQQTAQPILTDEHATRYVVLTAGAPSIEWGGVGENAITSGNTTFPRRTLIELVSIKIGARLESALKEESLNPLVNTDRRARDWHLDERRLITKSAKECAHDVIQLYGPHGATVLKSLTGAKYSDADQLFDRVLPPEIAAQPLVDVLKHLRSSSYDLNDTAFHLHRELLVGTERGFAYLDRHVRAIRAEIEMAFATGRGMRELDDVTREFFRELQVTAPEDMKSKQTSELGVQIAQAVVASNSGNTTNQLLAELLLKMDQRLAELEAVRTQAVAVTENTAEEVTAD